MLLLEMLTSINVVVSQSLDIVFILNVLTGTDDIEDLEYRCRHGSYNLEKVLNFTCSIESPCLLFRSLKSP